MGRAGVVQLVQVRVHEILLHVLQVYKAYLAGHIFDLGLLEALLVGPQQGNAGLGVFGRAQIVVVTGAKRVGQGDLFRPEILLGGGQGFFCGRQGVKVIGRPAGENRDVQAEPQRPALVPGKFSVSAPAIRLAGPQRGIGVIAGGAVRSVVSAAGIKNISSKVLGTDNKASNVYATIEALKRISERYGKEEGK